MLHSSKQWALENVFLCMECPYLDAESNFFPTLKLCDIFYICKHLGWVVFVEFPGLAESDR